MQIINGMQGLGDNIYSRPFIKKLAAKGEIYLRTPWPELYSDIGGIHYLRPDTELRTQKKNAARFSGWAPEPQGKARRIRYGSEGIYLGLRHSFGFEAPGLDLPDFGRSPISGRYVVVRPATVRDEWRADSRNPKPEYLDIAARHCQALGYQVVSVADLCKAERLVGDPPSADVCFHEGELPVEQLLALVQHASAVIGGIGWLVPATIAAKVPAWIVCGGQGGYNAPELITNDGMDLYKIEFAMPDKFCRCVERFHECNKEISDYESKLAAWSARHLAMV